MSLSINKYKKYHSAKELVNEYNFLSDVDDVLIENIEALIESKLREQQLRHYRELEKVQDKLDKVESYITNGEPMYLQHLRIEQFFGIDKKDGSIMREVSGRCLYIACPNPENCMNGCKHPANKKTGQI